MKTFLTFFKEKPLPILMMVICFLFLIYVVVDDTFTTKEITTAIVLEKRYVPEIETSQRYINGETGRASYSSNYSNEKFLIIAETSYSKVYTVACSPELYYHKIDGDNITIEIKRGVLSNSVVKVEALQ